MGFLLFLFRFFCFFEKKQVFVLFSEKKTQKTYFALFSLHHAVSSFSELQGKEMYRIFVFAKCCWLVNSLQSGRVWQACTLQTEKGHPHANSAVSRQVYVAYMPC